jgi:rod shape-determining protein MreC
MDYRPPPLFNQGVSARARLAFFSFLAVSLIVVDSRVRALESIRIGVGVVLYPVQQAMLIPGLVLARVGDYVTSITQLTRENEQLKRAQLENAQRVEQSEQLAAENANLRKLLGARERIGRPAVLAQVQFESRDRFLHKLVIDKGADDGLRIGQPVIDAIGVVGQVTRVFPLASEVTLLTDKEQTIPVQIVRNGLRGVAWGGVEPGTLDLRFMAANADIVDRDLLVTSGLDGVYPSGLPVATVVRVERSAKDQFARVVLAPAAGVQNNLQLLVLQVDTTRPPPPRASEERRNERRGTRK